MNRLHRIFIAGMLFAGFAAAAGSGEPWELWRQAYNDQMQAEQLLRQGKKPEAKLMYIRARNSYVAVKDARPDWNQDLINSRIALCESEAANLKDVETARSVTVPAAASEEEPSDEYKERYFKALMELDNMRKELEAAKASTMEISALLSEKRALQEEYSLLKNQYNDLKESSAAPSAELEAMRTRLLETQLTADNAVRRRDALSDSYEQLTADYDEIIAARNLLKDENQRLQGRLADLEKEMKQSRNNISAERERTARMENELKSREAEIEDLKRNIRRLSEDNSAIIRNISGNPDIDSGLKEEIKKYQERYEQLEQDYLNMNTENRQLSTALRELRLEASGHGDTISSLDALNKDLQEKNEYLETANASMDTRLKTAEENAAKFETKSNILAAENNELRTFAESLELRLKHREEGQITISEEYQKERQQLQDDLAAARLEAASLQGKAAGLEEKLNEEINRSSEMKNEYIDLKAAHMTMSLEMDKYKTIEERCALLEADLAAAASERDSLIARIAELEAAPGAPAHPAVSPAVLPGDPAANAEKAEKHLAAARKAVNDNFKELAVLEYQRLLKLLPDHQEANWELGTLYNADGRPAEALPYMKKACDLAPENTLYRKAYIVAAAAAGQNQEFLEIYSTLPEEMQQDREILHAKGKVLAMLNRWEEAAEIYAMPVVNEAPSPQFLTEYTRILVALDRNEEAAILYERAREAGAEADVSIESALGMKLDANRELCGFFETACDEAFAAGNWESVIWYSLKLIGMDADNPSYYFDWAYGAIILERGNEASAALAQAAVRTNGGEKERQMRLLLTGTAELLNEKPSAAAQAFKEAAAIGESAGDGSPVSVDPRYANLPAVISRLLEKLNNQPSVSRSDIEDAAASFSKLGF